MTKRDTFVRSLNQELKREVRLVALAQGITLGEALNQAMALWLVRESQEGHSGQTLASR